MAIRRRGRCKRAGKKKTRKRFLHFNLHVRKRGSVRNGQQKRIREKERREMINEEEKKAMDHSRT